MLSRDSAPLMRLEPWPAEHSPPTARHGYGRGARHVTFPPCDAGGCSVHSHVFRPSSNRHYRTTHGKGDLVVNTDDDVTEDGNISTDDNDEVMELTDQLSDDNAASEGTTDEGGDAPDKSVDESDDVAEDGAPSAAVVTRRDDSDPSISSDQEDNGAEEGTEVGVDPEGDAQPEGALKTVQMQAIDRRAIEREGQVRQLDQTLPLLSARFAPEIVVSSPRHHIETWHTDWNGGEPRGANREEPDASGSPPSQASTDNSAMDDSTGSSPESGGVQPSRSAEGDASREKQPTPARTRSHSPQSPPEVNSPPPKEQTSQTTSPDETSSEASEASSGAASSESSPDTSTPPAHLPSDTNRRDATDAKASQRASSKAAPRSTPKGKPVQPASGEPSPSRAPPDHEETSSDDSSPDNSDTRPNGDDAAEPSTRATADTPPAPAGAETSAPTMPESEPNAPREHAESDAADETSPASGESETSSSPETGSQPPPLVPEEERSADWMSKVFSEAFLLTLPESIPRRTAREAEFIAASLRPDSDDRILDLACGFGRHALELAQRGCQVVGFDISKELLEKALAEAERQSLQIKFFHGDMREMEFQGIFDHCFCWDTSFGYFDDATNRDILYRINRSLQPGGEFLLDVVNRDYVLEHMPHQRWWQGMDCFFQEEAEFDYESSVLHVNRKFIYEDGSRRPMEQDYQVRLYSLHELRRLFRGAGFRVEEVSGDIKYKGFFLGPESPRIIIRGVKERNIS